ncbi:hypothetical protein ANN_00925 [Periplaneta americana]|uniref:Integrase p58-like C-terminal domain-containing protein n=1 Tax=Periplaneta americana TaxID=6978 RepID=A0ABQ8TVD7_PERAM|nr:hypothetical protein ANN_00925 [Periplaneta americana]
MASDRMKVRYDRLSNSAGLQEGDLVWLNPPTRAKGKSPKLQRSWDGPYRVVSRINDVVYRIQRQPRGKMMVVHLDRLAAVRDGQPKGGGNVTVGSRSRHTEFGGARGKRATQPPSSLRPLGSGGDRQEVTILRDMLLELNDSCEQYGMKINANKTKTMVIGRKIKKSSTAVRAVPGRSQDNCCRHCHNEVETLAHVLGSCPHGEGLRNATHHQVRSIIATADYNTFEEVHGLSVTGSTRRIDIIAFKESIRSGFIIDSTVRFETDEEQPAEVDKEKKNIYNPTIPYYLQKYQLEELEVIGILVGARDFNQCHSDRAAVSPGVSENGIARFRETGTIQDKPLNSRQRTFTNEGTKTKSFEFYKRTKFVGIIESIPSLKFAQLSHFFEQKKLIRVIFNSDPKEPKMLIKRRKITY